MVFVHGETVTSILLETMPKGHLLDLVLAQKEGKQTVKMEILKNIQ